MTQHEENCPTCGSRLTALARAELRRCSACRRNNPAGFLYCGYCAAPMEHTEIRARLAEVPAPPGGWPNLAGDLAEVKFFLKQGQLDEAYDLLSILQRRYPGHPELADFARSSEVVPKPDAEVENLVDSVLADSASLGGKVPRRRATRWDAPASEPIERRGRQLTTAHEVVRAALLEDVEEADPVTNPQAKVVVAEYAKNPRPARTPRPKVERTTSFEAVPPKLPKLPRVKLREPGLPKPALWRDDVANARAVGEAAKKVKDSMRSADAPSTASPPPPPKAATPPPPPPPKAAKPSAPPKAPLQPPKFTGEPARVHMPAVRADEDSPSPAVSPEATTKKEAAAKKAAAKKAAAKNEAEKKQPQHTMAVDALQPPAPYTEKHNNTMAVDALQPPAPFEGEAPDAFEARKEQIKRATSRTGRGRRVTGANKNVKAATGNKKRKRPRGVPPKREEEGEQAKRPRGTAFGAGVLSRFGR